MTDGVCYEVLWFAYRKQQVEKKSWSVHKQERKPLKAQLMILSLSINLQITLDLKPNKASPNGLSCSNSPNAPKLFNFLSCISVVYSNNASSRGGVGGFMASLTPSAYTALMEPNTLEETLP